MSIVRPPTAPAIVSGARSVHLSRRSLFQAAFVGALAGPLAACGSNSGSGSPLDFYQSKREVLTYFDQLIVDFTAKTGIAVTHDSTTSLVASFVRDRPHDLLLQNYLLDFATFLKRGVLVDLSDMPEAKTIDPAVQALVGQYSDVNQGSLMPYSMTASGVVYNKDIFAGAGVEVPTTWTEMLAVCDKLKSKKITPLYMTIKDGWTTKQGLFDYITGSSMDVAGFFTKLRAAGTNIDSNSETSFTGSFKPAMQKVFQLAGYANGNAETRSYTDGNAAFAGGQAAMYFQGPWAIGEIAKLAPKLPVGTFPLPATDNPDDTKVRVNLDLGLAIPAGAIRQDAARQFISYLMTREVVEKYNSVNLAYAPIKGSTAPVDDRIAGLAPYVKSGKFYQGAGTYFPVTIPLENYLQEAVISKDANAFLAKLDNDWRRVAQRSV